LQEIDRIASIAIDRILNQKKSSFENTEDTSGVPSSEIIFLFGLLLGFLFVCGVYCYCARCGICTMAAILYGNNSQESSDTQQEPENIEVFSQPRPIQNNTPDSICQIATLERTESPPPTYLGESGAAFLPYRNTGTANQAPSANPV
jgi:hypothetical protein